MRDGLLKVEHELKNRRELQRVKSLDLQVVFLSVDVACKNMVRASESTSEMLTPQATGCTQSCPDLG